jgi:hypothetical protein
LRSRSASSIEQKIGTFRGESRFTTRDKTIAIRQLRANSQRGISGMEFEREGDEI